MSHPSSSPLGSETGEGTERIKVSRHPRGAVLGVMAAAAMLGADVGRGPSRTVTYRPEPKQGNANIDNAGSA